MPRTLREGRRGAKPAPCGSICLTGRGVGEAGVATLRASRAAVTAAVTEGPNAPRARQHWLPSDGSGHTHVHTRLGGRHRNGHLVSLLSRVSLWVRRCRALALCYPLAQPWPPYSIYLQLFSKTPPEERRSALGSPQPAFSTDTGAFPVRSLAEDPPDG